MATTAKAKFEKYFAGKSNVSTTIKPKAGKPIYFYPEVAVGTSTNSSRPIQLSDGDRITVIGSDQYSAQYRIELEDGRIGTVNEQFVAKPISGPGPTELLRCHSETLTRLGYLGELNVGAGAVEVRNFSSSDAVHRSIVFGLDDNWRVSNSIVRQFDELRRSPDKTNFKWKDEISEAEKNELGKYVGELLPGGLALSGDWSAFGESFLTFKPTNYAVPTDPSFSGVDSVLSDTTHACLISSKFGPGAKASVFSNILPTAVREYDYLVSGELRALVDSARSVSVTAETLEGKRGSKEVLYAYGLNQVLGMQVKSPMAIFQNLRSHVLEGSALSTEACDVLNEVASRAEPIIREKLPGSITQFFSRAAAERMNGDRHALDEMKTVLAMKDFVQLNLNMTKWRAGDINFKVRRSADSQIRVFGNKGVIGDIDSRQGLLNYEIR